VSGPGIVHATLVALHMSASVQVFGRRHDETIHGLMRPATEKRRGTKSRWGMRRGRGALYRELGNAGCSDE
jgi:hypothetical protein